MRFTERDRKLVRDIALSHILSRDQILELQYFGSITRTNTRLRDLQRFGFVRRIETPFFSQGLYAAGKRAPEVVGEKISHLLEGRAGSPRFLQHALSVTNVRIALHSKSDGVWRFEQQLWRKLGSHEIRPDGLLLTGSPIFIEVDMGHVAPSKFKEKLQGYQTLAHSGQCSALYGFSEFRLLTVTTGTLRARHLRELSVPQAGFEFLTQTFEEVGANPVHSWS